MRTVDLRVVAVLTACGLAGLAQEPANPETYVVRTDVNMILLHATVQDNKGAFVAGLPQSAFKVTEDGVPQQIGVFSSEDVPIAVGLVMDNSGSMTNRQSEVITGSLMFIRDSRPEDQIFVVNFNDRAELALPADKPFSNNAIELRTALMKGVVGGHTALYDAIALALEQLEKASLRKKVLLIISDGGDNRSTTTLDQVVKRADRAGVLMYTIGLFDEHSEDKNPGVLRNLARQTGGLTYLPSDLSELTNICSQIAKDIRSQYTIGYSSSKASLDSSYHNIKVTAVNDRGRQLRVRTRTGFYGVKTNPDR